MRRNPAKQFLILDWKKIITLTVLICLINFLIWVGATWFISYETVDIIIDNAIIPRLFSNFLYRSYYIDWVFLDVISLFVAFITDYILIGKFYPGISKRRLALISIISAYISLFTLVLIIPPIISPMAEVVSRIVLLPHWVSFE